MRVLVCSCADGLRDSDGEEFKFFNKENVKKINEKFEVVWNDTGRMFTEDELKEKVKDCDAVFTCWGSNKFTEDILKCAPKLKIIAHLAGSVAPYVSEAVYDRGIKVIGANDNFFSESVAEAALLYMLTGSRKVREVIHLMDGKKSEGWHKIFDARGLLDKTVGIVSYGAIAKHLVKMLQPFRCKIKVYSRSISDDELKKYNMERASLEEIFSTCDFISLHTAWNKHTENMINKELLSMIKDNAVLVNTARGKIIDEPAMIEELKKNRFYAVLDVYHNEPLPDDSPLYELENVTVFPHMGGPTHDRYKYIASALIDEVYDYLTENAPLKSEINREKALSMTIS